MVFNFSSRLPLNENVGLIGFVKLKPQVEAGRAVFAWELIFGFPSYEALLNAKIGDAPNFSPKTFFSISKYFTAYS